MGRQVRLNVSAEDNASQAFKEIKSEVERTADVIESSTERMQEASQIHLSSLNEIKGAFSDMRRLSSTAADTIEGNTEKISSSVNQQIGYLEALADSSISAARKIDSAMRDIEDSYGRASNARDNFGDDDDDYRPRGGGGGGGSGGQASEAEQKSGFGFADVGSKFKNLFGDVNRGLDDLQEQTQSVFNRIKSAVENVVEPLRALGEPQLALAGGGMMPATRAFRQGGSSGGGSRDRGSKNDKEAADNASRLSEAYDDAGESVKQFLKLLQRLKVANDEVKESAKALYTSSLDDQSKLVSDLESKESKRVSTLREAKTVADKLGDALVGVEGHLTDVFSETENVIAHSKELEEASQKVLNISRNKAKEQEKIGKQAEKEKARIAKENAAGKISRQSYREYLDDYNKQVLEEIELAQKAEKEKARIAKENAAGKISRQRYRENLDAYNKQVLEEIELARKAEEEKVRIAKENAAGQISRKNFREYLDDYSKQIQEEIALARKAAQAKQDIAKAESGPLDLDNQELKATIKSLEKYLSLRKEHDNLPRSSADSEELFSKTASAAEELSDNLVKLQKEYRKLVDLSDIVDEFSNEVQLASGTIRRVLQSGGLKVSDFARSIEEQKSAIKLVIGEQKKAAEVTKESETEKRKEIKKTTDAIEEQAEAQESKPATQNRYASHRETAGVYGSDYEEAKKQLQALQTQQKSSTDLSKEENEALEKRIKLQNILSNNLFDMKELHTQIYKLGQDLSSGGIGGPEAAKAVSRHTERIETLNAQMNAAQRQLARMAKQEKAAAEDAKKISQVTLDLENAEQESSKETATAVVKSEKKKQDAIEKTIEKKEELSKEESEKGPITPSVGLLKNLQLYAKAVEDVTAAIKKKKNAEHKVTATKDRPGAEKHHIAALDEFSQSSDEVHRQMRKGKNAFNDIQREIGNIAKFYANSSDSAEVYSSAILLLGNSLDKLDDKLVGLIKSTKLYKGFEASLQKQIGEASSVVEQSATEVKQSETKKQKAVKKTADVVEESADKQEAAAKDVGSSAKLKPSIIASMKEYANWLNVIKGLTQEVSDAKLMRSAAKSAGDTDTENKSIVKQQQLTSELNEARKESQKELRKIKAEVVKYAKAQEDVTTKTDIQVESARTLNRHLVKLEDSYKALIKQSKYYIGVLKDVQAEADKQGIKAPDLLMGLKKGDVEKQRQHAKDVLSGKTVEEARDKDKKAEAAERLANANAIDKEAKELNDKTAAQNQELRSQGEVLANLKRESAARIANAKAMDKQVAEKQQKRKDGHDVSFTNPEIRHIAKSMRSNFNKEAEEKAEASAKKQLELEKQRTKEIKERIKIESGRSDSAMTAATKSVVGTPRISSAESNRVGTKNADKEAAKIAEESARKLLELEKQRTKEVKERNRIASGRSDDAMTAASASTIATSKKNSADSAQ